MANPNILFKGIPRTPTRTISLYSTTLGYAITQNIRAFMEFDFSIELAPTAATDHMINALLGPYVTVLWRRGVA